MKKIILKATLALSLVALAFQNCGKAGKLVVNTERYDLKYAVATQGQEVEAYGTQPTYKVTPTIRPTSPTSTHSPPSSHAPSPNDHSRDFQKVHDASGYRPPFNLVGGPITRVGLRIHWCESPSGSGNLYEARQGAGGCFEVKVGDRCTLDSTPKGDNCGNWSIGQCNYTNGPVWWASGDPAFHHVPKDDNGFLMRIKPKQRGATDYVFVKVDGIESNSLCFVAK